MDVLGDVLERPRIQLSSACPVMKKFKPSDSIHVESNSDYDVN
jgi:hypothetical protein